jgi:AcrR family transcriptional regulator
VSDDDTAGPPGAGPAVASRPAQRRERERAAARATILAAALDLARTEGWEAVTMRRLADRIEYSANFAYRYFTGRDDILLALVRDGFTRLRQAMATAAATTAPGARGDDVPTAFRRAAHAYLDFALREPDLYQVMYGLGGVRVPTADTMVEGQAVGDVLTALLTSRDDDAADDAEGAAGHVLRLWATAHGLIALLAVGRVDVDPARLHALLGAAVDDVLARALPHHAPDRPRPAQRPPDHGDLP